MEADSNHLLLQMELKSFIDSCILFTFGSSSNVRSYSDMAKSSSLFVLLFISFKWIFLTNTKYNRLHFVKAMNPLWRMKNILKLEIKIYFLPFFPFRSLPTCVEHTKQEVFVTEVNFNNTRRFDSGPQDVLVGRDVARSTYSRELIEKVASRVIELVLS